MKGKCANCGTIFYGVSVLDPYKQKCTSCGARVQILENVPAWKLAHVPLKAMNLRKEGPD